MRRHGNKQGSLERRGEGAGRAVCVCGHRRLALAVGLTAAVHGVSDVYGVFYTSLSDKDGKSSTQFRQCNGALISNTHVLTAASCLQEPPIPRFNRTNRVVRVTVGEYTLEKSTDCVSTDYNTTCSPRAETFVAERVVEHEHFDRFSLHHDIAILQLQGSVEFNDFIQPICLSNGCGYDEVEPYINLPMIHAGWRLYWPNRGKTWPTQSMQKMERLLYISPGQGCDLSYLWIDNRTQLCTITKEEFPVEEVNCDSYAGGPLIIEQATHQVAAGIASYGESCSLGKTRLLGDPTVFTFVPAYTRWILKSLYFLKYGTLYPYKFNQIKWSTGIEGD